MFGDRNKSSHCSRMFQNAHRPVENCEIDACVTGSATRDNASL